MIQMIKGYTNCRIFVGQNGRIWLDGEVDNIMFELSKEELAKIKTVPGSLEKALESLESDNDFLRQGDVFTKDFIDGWVDYKIHKENDYIRLRPHPSEFYLYFDA